MSRVHVAGPETDDRPFIEQLSDESSDVSSEQDDEPAEGEGWAAIAQLDGHTGFVKALCFVHDCVATASHDTTIRIWDPRLDWECVAVLSGHFADVNSLCCYAGNLASGSDDNSVKIWNSSWTCFATLQAHQMPVIAISELNGMLATVSQDVVYVWDLSFNVIVTFRGHRAPLTAIASCASHLCTASRDKFIKVWSPYENWTCIHTLEGHRSPVMCLTNAGGLLASGGVDFVIKLWDPQQKWALVGTLRGHYGNVSALVYVNGMLCSGSWDKTFRVWSIDDQQQLSLRRERAGHITAMFPANGCLVTATTDAVRVWA